MAAGRADLLAGPTSRNLFWRLDRLWNRTAPYVFISPFFILFGIFGAFPILYALYLSFHKWQGLRPGPFVGFTNYLALLTDSQFRIAVTNTFILGFIYVPLLVMLSLGLAAVLNRPLRFRNFYRTGFFLPVITSMVVVGILFRFFFGSSFSPLSLLLAPFGVEFTGLMGQAEWVKPIIVVMLLWRWVGYNMMIMLAGLQGIPEELYDAGLIDGTSGIQAFRYITIPMMQRVIAFAAILSTIGMFNVFDEVYVVTNGSGGVQQAGLVTGLLIYRTAFSFYKFGYASAIAYAVAFIIIALSLLQIVASERTAS